jgi:triosephosphate isomerase
MKKYIIANWKMLPTTWAEAEEILDAMSMYFESASENKNTTIICPPFLYIEEAHKMLGATSLGQHVELGAQDISESDASALTGEVSGQMLQELDVQYIIVGHSERRWKLGESDDIVNKKIKAVLRNEMTPIVCLGEKIRDENFKDFLTRQTEATFTGLSADEIGKCLIAYEPVWAISSNPGAKPDTPESALESISVIQDILNTKYLILNTRFLYGGSVNSTNVSEFIAQKEIDGVLVGGASVKKGEFVKILSLIR